MTSNSAPRSTYLLLISLMVPACTAVLVAFYLYRYGKGIPGGGEDLHLRMNLIAIGAGVCAAMAAALDVALLIVYRQRNRFERVQRRQRQILEDMLEERLRMTRALDVLSASQQVTLAIKQETSFERIATVVLEQIEAFARAEDVVVFATRPDGELEPRARRWMSINTYGSTVETQSLELELPYEAMIKNQPTRNYNELSGEYSVAIPYSTTDGIRGVVLVRRNASDDPDFMSDLVQFENALVQLVKGVSVGLKFSAIWDRAIKDEMTGLFNKNHFNKEMPRLLRESIRNGRSFTMVMLDVDKFKHINDTFGHLPGDQVLRQVAGILLENLRTTDIAFRYGGEELCLICQETVDEDAARFAERLRSIIAHTEFRTDTGQLIPLTASFGIAEFDPATMTGETELKLRCDEALYHAKKEGRNQVVICRGTDDFEPLERSGDVATEVKRRLGLAGDNTPLEEAIIVSDRRTTAAKPGKVAKALAEQPELAALGDSQRGEAATQAHDAAAVAANDLEFVTSASFSIRKLAEQIIAAADANGERLAEVARIAEVAAIAIQESRRLPSARPGEKEDSATVKARERAALTRESLAMRRVEGEDDESAGSDAGDSESAKPKRKRAARKRKTPTNKIEVGDLEELEASAAPLEEESPPPARTSRRKTTRKRKTAAEKAEEARIEAEKHAADDSDRLDYITDEEAEQLAAGEAPSKRMRKASGESSVSSESGEEGESWSPRKHW